MSDPITCDDLPGSCCRSCHEDEEFDSVYTLWWDDWLYACCRRLDSIPAEVNWHCEVEVRAWLIEARRDLG